MQLFQKYAPKTFADVVGQSKAVATVKRIIGRVGFDRGAFFIDAAGDNNSGLGKSTMARVIAGELADDMFIEELDGASVDKRAVAAIREAAEIRSWNPGKPFKVWVINEAHAITSGALDLLLTFLEALPAHTVIIFTTTRKPDQGLFGDDNGPLYSRCFHITLTNQGLAQAFAERAKAIAEAEELDGKPIAAYVRLVQDCKNNFRAVLQRIEAGAMIG